MNTLSVFSRTPVPRDMQAEAAAQLRSVRIALRDLHFERRDIETRLADVIHGLNELVQKLEALIAPPKTEVQNGQ